MDEGTLGRAAQERAIAEAEAELACGTVTYLLVHLLDARPLPRFRPAVA